MEYHLKHALSNLLRLQGGNTSSIGDRELQLIIDDVETTMVLLEQKKNDPVGEQGH